MSTEDRQIFVSNVKSLKKERARLKKILKRKEKDFTLRKEYFNRNAKRLVFNSIIPGPSAITAIGYGLINRILSGKKKDKEDKQEKKHSKWMSFAGKGAIEVSLSYIAYVLVKKWIKKKFSKKEKDKEE